MVTTPFLRPGRGALMNPFTWESRSALADVGNGVGGVKMRS